MTKNKLWLKSGGRCEYEGCNEPLWKDEVTMAELNAAYIAHIVSASPSEVRGNPIYSFQLSDDFQNLMLLCDIHHRLIDVEKPNEHTVELLKAMKLAHEQRIELLTGIHSDKKTEILMYGANIGAQAAAISYPKAIQAVLPKRYPTKSDGISLSMKNSSFRDDDPTFWEVEKDNLKSLFEQRVMISRQDGRAPHVSIFALAPQPLLIYLGSLLSDLVEGEVFQLHREPQGWCWPETSVEIDFVVEEPKIFNGCPVLILSLSADITDQRVADVMGDRDHSVWRVSIKNPNNDFLKNQKCLLRFRIIMRSLLNKIKEKHGETEYVHIFPAAPVSVCVELGRVRMPKADLPFRIYDQKRGPERSGFFKALDIGNI